jgi:hypothetical protein
MILRKSYGTFVNKPPTERQTGVTGGPAASAQSLDPQSAARPTVRRAKKSSVINALYRRALRRAFGRTFIGKSQVRFPGCSYVVP